MEWLIEVALTYPRRFLLVSVLLVGGLGTFIWWQVVWLSPQQIFSDMLANNLATTSVTRQVNDKSSSQSIRQTIRLQTGSVNAADWLVTAAQTGSSVTTESIATPTTGYLRYVHVSTQSETSSQYTKFLNIWAKSDGQTDGDLNQLFAETVLDVTNVPAPPIARLPSDERENLLQNIRDNKVFTPDYGSVKVETLAGHSVDTFSVSVQLSAYVQMMQLFAHDMGMHRLDQLDANQYVGLTPITISMSVDRESHQLVQISNPSDNFSQSYSEWGLAPEIIMPHATLTTTELQHELAAVSQK